MSYKSAFFAFLKGETSQAELDAYRRAASQIDDLEAAIESKSKSANVAAGEAPWQRSPNEQQGAAFTWIARGLTTIANALLDSDAKEDPTTAGYLPLVTFGQSKALYAQAPAFIHRAWEALANPRYRSDKPLPMSLAPRVEADGKCPLVHLKGMLAAARELDAYGQTRLNAYLAANTGNAEHTRVIEELSQIRARAQSKLNFAADQLAVLSDGRDVPLETHEEAETRLWEALSDHFLLGQFLVMPELLQSAAVAGHNATGRQIAHEDRWCLSEKDAVRELKNSKFGEQEIREFWTLKAWRTTPREERYFAQCEAFVKEGALTVVSRWSTTPFDPVYMALRPVSILDIAIDAKTEFHLEMDENEDKIVTGTPRFRRTAKYEEGHEEGHVSDQSTHHDD